MPAGPARMVLGIAGFRLAFVSPDPAFSGLLTGSYRPFLSRGRPDFTLDLRAVPGRQSPFRPAAQETPGRLRLRRGDFDLRLETGTRLGCLDCAPRLQAFDSFLRAFFSWLLPRENGLLLHAAGFALWGGAHVFPGRSGAGKSTLSRLAEGRARLLSDELVPVRRENGRWYAYGSPFWGEMRRGGEPLRVPLRGVYGLVKAGANSLEPAAPGRALRRLLRCAMNFSRQPAAAERLLRTAALLALEKNAGELRFSKSGRGFLDLL